MQRYMSIHPSQATTNLTMATNFRTVKSCLGVSEPFTYSVFSQEWHYHPCLGKKGCRKIRNCLIGLGKKQLKILDIDTLKYRGQNKLITSVQRRETANKIKQINTKFMTKDQYLHKIIYFVQVNNKSQGLNGGEANQQLQAFKVDKTSIFHSSKNSCFSFTYLLPHSNLRASRLP